MTGPSHSDIHRDIGGLEAGLEALKEVVREGFKDTGTRLDRVDVRLANLETKESGRSAVERFAVWFAGLLGAVLAVVADHFWK